ncbi:MAG: zf-HC2 domain-containing protein [Fimbriimonadales bacterium]|nr:zf-HC2 domain-containing protein [Fimbriimonadales bacterium]
MNCRNAQAKLSALLDGELGGNEALLVREHLRQCARCSAEWRELRALKLALGQLTDAEPPAGLEDRLLAAVRRQGSERRTIRLWVPAAAAAAAACATLALLQAASSEPRQTVVQRTLPPVPSTFEVDRDQAYVSAADPFGPGPVILAAGYGRR